MTLQSCNHILLVEPDDFHSNPQTMETNTYQSENPDELSPVRQGALQEHIEFRNKILSAGIAVTIAKGSKDTPDDIFAGNCYSTHQDGTAYIYSMMAPNRRLEKKPHLTDLIGKMYDNVVDLSEYEEQGIFLEGTSSMIMDRVNRVLYSSLSARTNEDMVKKWADKMGYEPVIFHSTNHLGKSVYHTDLIIYIGTDVAGVVSGCIDDEFVKPVLNKLEKTHDVVQFRKEQLIQMVGNSLEVRNKDDEKCLIMSDTAFEALDDKQLSTLEKYFGDRILHTPMKTIEKYGGGSARCQILELF